MIRTKGNMVRTKIKKTMERTSQDVKTLSRTKLPGTHVLSKKEVLTPEAIFILNMVERNACGYHIDLSKWIPLQPVAIQLAYCHPLDREGYKTKLNEVGVTY